MGNSNTLDRLQIRLTYWIKHNLEHAREFREWARDAGDSGLGEIALKLGAAAEEMEAMNAHLQGALDLLERSSDFHTAFDKTKTFE